MVRAMVRADARSLLRIECRLIIAMNKVKTPVARDGWLLQIHDTK